MSEILHCKNLSKRYGNVYALNDVSFTLESGKIVGLLGPNGSGKTTIIKLINGLLTPDVGYVTIQGNIPGLVSKTQVAYLPDCIYLNSWMTVRQILCYFQDFFWDFRMGLAEQMLSRLGIPLNKRLKTLSKGNKEKVCLISR